MCESGFPVSLAVWMDLKVGGSIRIGDVCFLFFFACLAYHDIARRFRRVARLATKEKESGSLDMNVQPVSINVDAFRERCLRRYPFHV